MAFKPRNEIQAALTWLEDSATDKHRAVSIRSTGEGDYLIKYFENCMPDKEFMITSNREWHGMLKQIGEQQ